MQIAVASGKGGTGKTTLATSLALSLAELGKEVHYVDCDVEAPNGQVFLNPSFTRQIPAVIQIPRIRQENCTLCGKCVEVCQFHALAKIGKSILVFPQLCHGCGSCSWNCPENAIDEIPRPIGVLDNGIADGGLLYSRGVLTIGEPMPTPVIRQLKCMIPRHTEAIIILDAPPGASCSVVETIRGVDFALLVTEPTPFGYHDLRQMLGIVTDLKIPAGIVINRDGIGDGQINEFLVKNHLRVFMRIPFERSIAEGLAAGKPLVNINPQYRQDFQKLYGDIVNCLQAGTKC